MKRIVTSMLLTAALIAPGASALAQDESKPKVIGLLFYADWCASCKVLEPKLDAVKKGFADRPVLFTRVDMTDDYTKSQSKLLAGALELGSIYADNAPKTGYMLLINASDKKVLGKLDKTQSEEQIKANIAAALSPASLPAGSGTKPAPGSGTK